MLISRGFFIGRFMNDRSKLFPVVEQKNMGGTSSGKEKTNSISTSVGNNFIKKKVLKNMGNATYAD